MKSRVRDGVVVVGCVLVGFVVSAGPGLVARAAEPDRWRERLMAQVAAGEQQGAAHAAQTLGAVEGERGAAPPVGSARSTDSEQEALLAQNRELLRQNRALLIENRALAEARARASGACMPPDGEDAKAQLFYWGERLRSSGDGLRGGLNSTQAAALGVLLRPTRPLDRDNPWK